MKRYIGIGIAILAAGGLSEMIQGILLTWGYEPSPYAASGQLMLPSFVQHGLTASIAVVLIYGAGKLRKRKPDIPDYSEDVP